MILVFIYNDEFIYLQNTSDKVTKNLCIGDKYEKINAMEALYTSIAFIG
jgi:hypothetical protein